jgi:hypothetical protein
VRRNRKRHETADESFHFSPVNDGIGLDTGKPVESVGAKTAVRIDLGGGTGVITKGGLLPPLLEALTKRQARRAELMAAIAAHEAIDATRLDRKAIERKVRSSIAQWQARLTSRIVEEKRHALRKILVGPVTLIRKAERIGSREKP